MPAYAGTTGRAGDGQRRPTAHLRLLLPLLALAACNNTDGTTATTSSEPTGLPATTAAAAPRILCARGTAALARDCTVERTADDQGVILTVRSPDGGFRRLRVASDGTGAVAADGAEPARVTAIGHEIEVELGGDRYRLPAQ